MLNVEGLSDLQLVTEFPARLRLLLVLILSFDADERGKPYVLDCTLVDQDGKGILGKVLRAIAPPELYPGLDSPFVAVTPLFDGTLKRGGLFQLILKDEAGATIYTKTFAVAAAK